MRIVLNTNVVVAAFAARGLCQSVFELCLDQHEIAISSGLLHEIRNSLQKKLKMPMHKADDIIDLLEEYGNRIAPTPLQAAACRDSSNDKILELSRTSEARYIVTGDKDLLVLGHFESIPIVTPRQFWESLKQGKHKNEPWSGNASGHAGAHAGRRETIHRPALAPGKRQVSDRSDALPGYSANPSPKSV